MTARLSDNRHFCTRRSISLCVHGYQ